MVTGSWDAKTRCSTRRLGNIAPAYSFAAQAVEVEVDTETGQVTVVDSFVVDDCGKAFNPLAVHGQSNGAAAQAIGWTLYEQLQLDDGRIANGNFADYTMPTADALPDAAQRHRRIDRPQRPVRRQGRQRNGHPAGRARHRQRGVRRRRRAHHRPADHAREGAGRPARAKEGEAHA
jgi:hypothetical protein